jgi:uncharacterized membrane protein YtjA (UPF0391 family)
MVALRSELVRPVLALLAAAMLSAGIAAEARADVVNILFVQHGDAPE